MPSSPKSRLRSHQPRLGDGASLNADGKTTARKAARISVTLTSSVNHWIAELSKRKGLSASGVCSMILSRYVGGDFSEERYKQLELDLFRDLYQK